MPAVVALGTELAPHRIQPILAGRPAVGAGGTGPLVEGQAQHAEGAEQRVERSARADVAAPETSRDEDLEGQDQDQKPRTGAHGTEGDREVEFTADDPRRIDLGEDLQAAHGTGDRTDDQDRVLRPAQEGDVGSDPRPIAQLRAGLEEQVRRADPAAEEAAEQHRQQQRDQRREQERSQHGGRGRNEVHHRQRIGNHHIADLERPHRAPDELGQRLGVLHRADQGVDRAGIHPGVDADLVSLVAQVVVEREGRDGKEHRQHGELDRPPQDLQAGSGAERALLAAHTRRSPRTAALTRIA